MSENKAPLNADGNFSNPESAHRFNLPVLNQQMLYNIFMHVPAPLCLIQGKELRYVFANDSYKKFAGDPNIIGKPMRSAGLVQFAENFYTQLLDVYNTGKPLYIQEMAVSRTQQPKEKSYLDINAQLYFSSDEEDVLLFMFAYDVTQQVMSRKTLITAEEKFRNLFYNLPTPLYTCNPQGKISLYNTALVEFLGKMPDDSNCCWFPFRQVYLPGGVPFPENKLSFIRENTRHGEGLELICELHDGSYKTVRYYPELIGGDNGNEEIIVNTLIDVTAQANARKELESLARVIENLYRDAPAFICSLRGPEFIYEMINPAYQQMLGETDPGGKRFFDVNPELKDQGFSKLLRHVYHTGKPYVGTERLVYLSRKEDEEPHSVYMNFSVQPLQDAGNQISGVLIFGYDVTDLVYSRMKGEENLKKILESLPQITSISSAEGTNIYFNNFFYQYSGLSREEASEHGWNSILHPDERDDVLKDWESCKEKEIEFRKDLRLRRVSDGMYRWHIVSLIPVKNNTGELLQWVASATDIHEQKWKEEKKDEFLSIASHELKTPLTSVKAYLQLSEMSLPKDDEVYQYIKKAIVSVDRLESLISELLDVSKIQQQKLTLHLTHFDFDQMLRRVVESSEFTNIRHRIIKRGEIISDVYADEERLEQVISNIIGNAVKYSPEGDDILVEVKREEGMIKVSVTDHGIGIPAHNLKKIFERYFRAEGHDIHFQGLGIGLFISNEIIKMHGGDLWVKSTPGEGSKFSFLIPI